MKGLELLCSTRRNSKCKCDALAKHEHAIFQRMAVAFFIRLGAGSPDCLQLQVKYSASSIAGEHLYRACVHQQQYLAREACPAEHIQIAPESTTIQNICDVQKGTIMQC